MQQDHSKAIKGLSIAAIVISALGIIVTLISMAVLTAVFDIAETYGYSTYDTGYPYFGDYYGYGSFDSDEIMAMQIASALSNGLCIWACVCCIFTLVVGIIGLRFSNNKEKLGMVFGWAIAGAVVGFIGTGIITAVLMIIIAVFANKDKKLYQAGYAQAPQAATVQTNPVYAQPQATQAPTTQTPATPDAPAAPVAPLAQTPVAQEQTTDAPASTPVTENAAPTVDAAPSASSTEDPNKQS